MCCSPASYIKQYGSQGKTDSDTLSNMKNHTTSRIERPASAHTFKVRGIPAIYPRYFIATKRFSYLDTDSLYPKLKILTFGINTFPVSVLFRHWKKQATRRNFWSILLTTVVKIMCPFIFKLTKSFVVTATQTSRDLLMIYSLKVPAVHCFLQYL